MIDTDFHVFTIVEGKGEVMAVPKLLHRLWEANIKLPPLRTGKRPFRVDRDGFINNQKMRREYLNKAGHRARHCCGGVLILLDAEEECCYDFVHGDKIKKIHADIGEILADVPHFFALAEKGYESWLVAGFGGNNTEKGVSEKWLNANKDKTGRVKNYRKTVDQCELTSQMDIQRARSVNPSFNRFCERFLEWGNKADATVSE